MSSFNLLNQV